MDMTFDRMVCINLDSRQDRWKVFKSGLPKSLLDVQRMPAVTGGGAPAAFVNASRSAGAWGCLQSHLQILKHALDNNLQCVLVMEDDAICCEGFDEKCKAYLAAVPDGDALIYLGGQHLQLDTRRPTTVNSEVVKPYNVNRTHAMIWRGQSVMRFAYSHLQNWERFPSKNHLDHRLGEYIAAGKLLAYAPAKEWLVGQRADKSDVSRREFNETRFWNPSAAQKLVLVVGLHRSGSSALAGALHRLGVWMGSDFVGCEQPESGHEERSIRNACEAACRYPRTVLKHSYEQELLRAVDKHIARKPEKFPVAGIKYPHLCAVASSILDAFPHAVIVHADRLLGESVASLIRRDGHRHEPAKIIAHQEWLNESKLRTLAAYKNRVAATVTFDELVQDPGYTLSWLSAQLWLAASTERFAEAVAWINPGKRRKYDPVTLEHITG